MRLDITATPVPREKPVVDLPTDGEDGDAARIVPALTIPTRWALLS
jgi:hypothetical protein